MAKQFSMQIMNLGSHWHPSKLRIVEADVLADVGVDDVYLTIGNTIELRRAVEIFETAKFLVDAMRDNNQLSSAAGPLYISCEVSDRHGTVLQTTDRVLITDANMAIGIGANVNVQAEQFSQTLDTAFRNIREYMKDEYLKQL